MPTLNKISTAVDTLETGDYRELDFDECLRGVCHVQLGVS
jgi:hypothetical protein